MPPSIADGPQESKDQWVFLQAGAWPDIARNQPRYHHGAWHYVNFPHFVSTKDKEGLDLSHINLDSQLPVTVDNEDGLNILQAMFVCLSHHVHIVDAQGLASMPLLRHAADAS
jgi:hypothetical protein